MTEFILGLDADVQKMLVSGVLGLFASLVGGLLEMLRRHHKRLGQVQEQVQNSHTTNLRDDMDALHDDVRTILGLSTQNTKDIGALREDLRTERRERKEADAELTLVVRADRKED